MPKSPRVTVREVITRLKAEGWYLQIQESSHRQYKHPEKAGRVTVAGPPSDVLNPKTLKSICAQAGWKGWKST
ncbi:MAG: type II toxin-antitoxin system HicA family toxin [bacterium]